MPDQVVCTQEHLAQALREGVFIHHDTRLSDINQKHGKLASIMAQRIRWKIPGSLHPDNAQALPESKFSLKADKLIMAIGSRIPPELTTHLEQAGIHLEHDLIVINEAFSTSLPGVYACGDAIASPVPRLIVQAVKEGKATAAAVADFIHRKQGSHATA